MDAVDRIHRRVVDADLEVLAVGRDEVRRTTTAIARVELPLATGAELESAIGRVLARIDGLGPLEELLSGPGVTDVLIDGPGPVVVERDGVLVDTDLELDAATIEHLAQRVVTPLGLRLDRLCPTVDARLPDGSRFHAVLPPLAVDGPYLSIRRFAPHRLPLGSFGGPAVVGILEGLVRRRANVVVAGPTGAGKTTLLRALLAHRAPGERVVILEESTELPRDDARLVRLVTRGPNVEGLGAVDAAALVRQALRMRPDRIVVGEVRGPEALDLVQALSTGHAGSMATVHATSASAAVRRLVALASSATDAPPHEALRPMLGAALDAVVVVARVDGRRTVRQIVVPDPGGDPDLGTVLVDDGAPVGSAAAAAA